MASQGGYSLIAVIVEATVLLVSFLGLYIGILYAEAQLIQNYHTRVATLLAAGELDWQMRSLHVRNEPDMFLSRNVVIEEYADGTSLKGVMTMDATVDEDQSMGDSMIYTAVEVKIRWTEPADNKIRSIVMREDYYR